MPKATQLTAHPAAAVWPMLPEPDLRRLADDIAANGLRFPIVLDTGGRVLDGRNRLAACQIGGIEPEYETYEGDDPVGYVLSANNERRHLSLPERAAATALTLASGGRRKGGRWDYGSVNGTAPEKTGSGQSTGWRQRMNEAGLVLDHLGEARLKRVADGKEALDAAVRQAKTEKARQARRKDLPADLGALVDADELTIEDAERRAKLSDRYTKLVGSGDLSLDEAEHLNDRDARDYRAAIQRAKDDIEGFLFGWITAARLSETAIRDDVLNALSDHDRERFLTIERETRWPTKTI